jgi:hypothetical protein
LGHPDEVMPASLVPSSKRDRSRDWPASGLRVEQQNRLTLGERAV